MDFSSFTTKLASVVLYATWQETIYGYMYNGVQFGGRLDWRLLPHDIVCGGRPFARELGCTQYIRNSTSEYFVSWTSFSTRREVRLGSCLCINVINDRSLDDVEIVNKISSVVHEIWFFEYSTSGFDRKERSYWGLSVHEMSHREYL